MSDYVRLREGELVRTDGRIWRVGLVNECRARLDPLAGTVTIANPVTGSTTQVFGNSINVSPNAMMERVDPALLDQFSIQRLGRMEMYEGKRRETMSETAATETATDKKASNLARLAEIKAKREAAKKSISQERQEKTAKNAAKKGKELNSCKCGCNGKTVKFFVPGHDAVFKGKLMKIERGEARKEEVLPKAVVAEYTWKKSAHGGEVPTKNYKGEPHTGYVKGDPAPKAAKVAKTTEKAKSKK